MGGNKMRQYLWSWTIFFSFMYSGSIAAAWSPPVEVSTIGRADAPQIVIDPNGNTTVVWVEFVDANPVIQSSSKPFGGGWQAPVTFSSIDQYASAPQISVDQNGNTTAVWVGHKGDVETIHASTRPFGGDWQTTPDDLSEAAERVFTPHVAIDTHGNATAVWALYNGTDYLIQASTKPFGGNWQTTPDTLSAINGNAFQPKIAIDLNGNATTVWETINGSDTRIQSSTKPYDGAWQVIPTNISPIAAVLDPHIVIDGQGNATVVWSMSPEIFWVIHASTRPYGGSWQATPDIISQPDQNAWLPQTCVDAHGNVCAVWIRYNGANWIVQSSKKPFGGSWQAIPDDLSQPGQDANHPQIVFDVHSNVTAIWRRSNGTNTIIQTSQGPFGGTWQTAMDLSQPGQDADAPQIATDLYGNITAVWTLFNSIHTTLQASTNFFGPAVTGLSPASGPGSGGNTVTITGTDFVDVTSVLFGPTPASHFTVESPTTITAIAPPGRGTVDVTVTASSITSSITPADQYLYQSQPRPPTRFRGKSKCGKKQLSLKTKWKKSLTANIRQYEIFSRKKLIGIISATRKTRTTLHLHPHHLPHHLSKSYRKYLGHKYKIRVVDATGAASPRTSLYVKY